MSAYAAYLLTWNPGKFLWDDFQDDWEAVNLGYKWTGRWSCGNTKKIKRGDRIFLMKLGWRIPIHGIFASGWVISEPFSEGNWNPDSDSQNALYVEMVFDAIRHPDLEPLLEPETIDANFNWHPQRAGIMIPDTIATKLETAWKSLLAVEVSAYVPSRGETDQYHEGKQSKILVNRYERNPEARCKCIEHHGVSCAVCGFNFEKLYGDIGIDFTHVHHLKPLSMLTTEYVIDPIKDLIPVCPNCHAMLHRQSPPFSIEELKSMLRKKK